MDNQVVLPRPVLLAPRLGLGCSDALGGAEDGGKAGDEGDAQHVSLGVDVNACEPLCLKDRVTHGGLG